MKVKDLIKELQECNQEANVSIVVGNEDKNSIDTYDFEIHAKDVDEYIELFVYTGKEERIMETLNQKEMLLLKEIIGMKTNKCFYCGKTIKKDEKFSIFNKPDRLVCNSIICLAEATDEV